MSNSADKTPSPDAGLDEDSDVIELTEEVDDDASETEDAPGDDLNLDMPEFRVPSSAEDDAEESDVEDEAGTATQIIEPSEEVEDVARPDAESQPDHDGDTADGEDDLVETGADPEAFDREELVKTVRMEAFDRSNVEVGGGKETWNVSEMLADQRYAPDILVAPPRVLTRKWQEGAKVKPNGARSRSAMSPEDRASLATTIKTSPLPRDAKESEGPQVEEVPAEIATPAGDGPAEEESEATELDPDAIEIQAEITKKPRPKSPVNSPAKPPPKPAPPEDKPPSTRQQQTAGREQVATKPGMAAPPVKHPENKSPGETPKGKMSPGQSQPEQKKPEQKKPEQKKPNQNKQPAQNQKPPPAQAGAPPADDDDLSGIVQELLDERTQEAEKAPVEPPTDPRRANWFVDTFGEEYLRTLPEGLQEKTEREVDFIIKSLGVKKGARILDLACGFGRHSIQLARREFEVAGLDLSMALLQRALNEAQRQSLSIKFIHGDMRELNFAQIFDGCFCWQTSFGYFEESVNMKVLKGIHRALKPGGRLLIDVLNRDHIMDEMPMRTWWEGKDCVFLEEVEFDPMESVMHTKRSFIYEDGSPPQEFSSFIRLYSLHELRRLLGFAGFKVLEVSGELFHRGSFLGQKSRRIIVLAEKIAQKKS